MKRAVAAVVLMLVTGCVIPKLPASEGELVPEMQLSSLEPGAAYVSSFPLEERAAVCRYLQYTEATHAFDECLRGYFPQNPALPKATG